MSSRLRTVAAAIASLGLLAALAPGIASAAFGSSQITSPSDPFIGFFDLRHGADPTFTVSGTVDSTGATGQTVVIYCSYPGTLLQLGSTTVKPDLSFEAEIPASQLAGESCTLRALPDPPPVIISLFRGPRAYGGFLDETTLSDGPNAGKVSDFDLVFGTPGGQAEIRSAGNCGLTLSPRAGAGPSPADSAFKCSGYYYYVDGNASSGQVGSEITVDDHPAYVTPAKNSFVPDTNGMRPVDYQVSHDPETDTVTLDQTAFPQRCRDTDEPNPDAAACGELIDTPVELTREWKASGNGKVSLTETWTSADGADHHLVLEPDVDLYSGTSAIDFPWLDSGFQRYTGRPTLAGPPSAPASMFVVTDTDTSNSNLAYGALTFSVAPQSIRFWDESSQYLELVYDETVGPGHPFSFRWIFNASQSEQAVRDAAALAEISLTSQQSPPATTSPPPPSASALPEAKCRVPRLLHSQLRVAKRRLAGANCAVGKVRRVYRTHRVARRRKGKKIKVRVPYARGLVLAQKPKQGTVRPAGAKVDLVVQGRKPHRRR